jgi:hypothetical protein
MWHRSDLEKEGWRPPSCTGWSAASRSQLVVALSGSFHFKGDPEQLLARVGAISELRNVKYWSTTDQMWRVVANDAHALPASDATKGRPDFSAGEMKKGATLYYWEDDSRLGPIVYKLTILDRTVDRAVVASESLTPVRRLYVTLLKAGALQWAAFFVKISPDTWGIYILNRVGEGAGLLSGGHEASYVNHTVALYRHFAGIQTDLEPPAIR